MKFSITYSLVSVEKICCHSVLNDITTSNIATAKKQALCVFQDAIGKDVTGE